MGISRLQGEIFDQALVSYIDYARAGFTDQAAFDAALRRRAIDRSARAAWDLNREMTFRIAWKPYMYSQTLPHLLGGVQTPALVVWGADDRIVPRSAASSTLDALPERAARGGRRAPAIASRWSGRDWQPDRDVHRVVRVRARLGEPGRSGGRPRCI